MIRVNVAAAIVRENQILAIEYDDDSGLHYNLPGGGVEEGELLTEALAREVREEAGVEIEPGPLLITWEYEPARENFRYGTQQKIGLIYAATCFPLLWWHAHPPRAFRWFVEGDFVEAPWLRAAVGPAAAAYAALAALYVGRAIQRALRGAQINVGKHVVVAGTAATWYVGIVALDSDFAFTVTNVITHGVPYRVNGPWL